MQTLSTVFAYTLGAISTGLMIGLMVCVYVMMHKPVWAV